MSTSTPLAVAMALLCTVATAHGEPLPLRNQHPLAVPFGLPTPLPARIPAGTRLSGATSWANFAVTGTSGGRSFTLDGEVFETRAGLDQSLGSRCAMRAELAYRKLDEGSLDGVIESWHDFFGLPNGSRNRLPEDELLLEYAVDGTTVWRIDESAFGVADVPVAFGCGLRTTETSAASAWLTLKAPVGEAEDLTGSGALDVALSLAADSRPHERWQLFGQANLAWLGDGDLLPDLQESYAWSLLAGTSWNAWRGLDLTVQVEANSDLFDTGIAELDGGATVLTFGGSYATAGGWRFDLAVSEDIDVDASPDFVLGLRARRDFPPARTR